jgi:hypothetical protein
MKIEFPETLEEITVWAMEHAGDVSISYFTQLYYSHRLMQHVVKQQIHAWIKRIAQLEGAVTNERIPNRSINPWDVYYRVRVAGIEICKLDRDEKNEIFGDCE